jgi:hypothetical protein
LSLAVALSIIVSWYLYAIAFNKANHTIFFGTKAMKGWPLWENNLAGLKDSINYFRSIHVEILSPVNLFLFSLAFFLMLTFINRVDRLLLKIWFFLCIGLLLFIAYFWKGFQDQQYYLVNLIILPIVTILLAYNIVLSFHLNEKMIKLGYTLLICSTLFVIYKSKNIYKCYYEGGWRHQKLNEAYYNKNIESELTKFGITKNDKVISLEDGTPNGTLSMLNRRGWSSYGFNKNKQFANDAFDSKIKMGARFLILNDTTLLRNEAVKYYAQTALGNYKGLYFYKLRNH